MGFNHPYFHFLPPVTNDLLSKLDEAWWKSVIVHERDLGSDDLGMVVLCPPTFNTLPSKRRLLIPSLWLCAGLNGSLLTYRI